MTTYSFVDESGETRLRGTLDPAPGGALPAQWQVDADGTLNILDNADVIRVTLEADGRLNVYRADGTIGAQVSTFGVVRIFNAAEDVIAAIKETGRLSLGSVTLPAFALDVIVTETDPTSGAGIVATRGSLCLGDGLLYVKFGNADTDWTIVYTRRNQAGHVDPATGTAEDIANALIASGLMAS